MKNKKIFSILTLFILLLGGSSTHFVCGMEEDSDSEDTKIKIRFLSLKQSKIQPTKEEFQELKNLKENYNPKQKEEGKVDTKKIPLIKHYSNIKKHYELNNLKNLLKKMPGVSPSDPDSPKRNIDFRFPKYLGNPNITQEAKNQIAQSLLASKANHDFQILNPPTWAEMWEISKYLATNTVTQIPAALLQGPIQSINAYSGKKILDILNTAEQGVIHIGKEAIGLVSRKQEYKNKIENCNSKINKLLKLSGLAQQQITAEIVSAPGMLEKVKPGVHLSIYTGLKKLVAERDKHIAWYMYHYFNISHTETANNDIVTKWTPEPTIKKTSKTHYAKDLFE